MNGVARHNLASDGALADFIAKTPVGQDLQRSLAALCSPQKGVFQH